MVRRGRKIDIVRTIGTKATLAKIDPAVIYGPDDRIELALTGADFVAGNSGENTILFNGDAQKVAWDGCGPADRATWKDAEKDEIHGGAEPGQIQLCNVSVAKQANILIAVKQGPEVTAAKRLSTYRWTQWEIILASSGVVGLAALLIVGLMCFKPSLREISRQLGGKIEDTRTMLQAAMPALRKANSKLERRSRCLPTPLVRKIRFATNAMDGAELRCLLLCAVGRGEKIFRAGRN